MRARRKPWRLRLTAVGASLLAFLGLYGLVQANPPAASTSAPEPTSAPPVLPTVAPPSVPATGSSPGVNPPANPTPSFGPSSPTTPRQGRTRRSG